MKLLRAEFQSPEPGRRAFFCSRLLRRQIGAAAGGEENGGPAEPLDPGELAEPRKSSKELPLSDKEPKDLQNP